MSLTAQWKRSENTRTHKYYSIYVYPHGFILFAVASRWYQRYGWKTNYPRNLHKSTFSKSIFDYIFFTPLLFHLRQRERKRESWKKARLWKNATIFSPFQVYLFRESRKKLQIERMRKKKKTIKWNEGFCKMLFATIGKGFFTCYNAIHLSPPQLDSTQLNSFTFTSL